MTCAGCSSDPGLLLALNGADERLQVALGRLDGALLAAQEWTVPGEAVRFLAPGVRAMLDGLGAQPGQVRRVVCVAGPGSFTGLRMSLALAQGLAAASDAAKAPELAGLNHLELLAGEAAGMLTPGSGSVAALVWSRRGQVYAQAFAGGAQGPVALDRPQVQALEAMAEYFSTLPRPVRLLGGGLRRNLAFFEGLAESDDGLVLLPEAWDAPRPAFLLALAARAEFGPGPLQPVYLRASDAEDNLAAIAAGRGLGADEAQAILDRGSREI